MKILLYLSTLFILIISPIFSVYWDDFGVLDSGTVNTVYCNESDACWLAAGISLVKTGVDDIQTAKKSSEFIQDVVIYLLWFVSFIAVLFIIYSWFRILTSSWDEDTIKTSKNRIIYVIVGILIIWFAWTITNWAIQLWDK